MKNGGFPIIMKLKINGYPKAGTPFSLYTRIFLHHRLFQSLWLQLTKFVRKFVSGTIFLLRYLFGKS